MMNNRNNMVPVCVRGLGLDKQKTVVPVCVLIDFSQCGEKPLPIIWTERTLSFKLANRFQPIAVLLQTRQETINISKSHSPTLDITKLLAEKSKLRSKHHGSFEEKSGL